MFKAPLVEVDSSLPPGYPCSRGSLPSASVSPGLFDQIAFKDQMRADCFFLSEADKRAKHKRSDERFR